MLIELNDYYKNIQQFIETLNLPNYNEESMVAKYRCKVKEDETRNVSNWNKHFDKLKDTHSEEQDSNEIDNLLKYAEKATTNENCQIQRNYQKKRLSQLPPVTQLQSTRILNLSNLPLTENEIDILNLGLSFTQTPKKNITKPENDVFHFTRKLRSTDHYQNSNIVDESIVKLESTYTPKPNENADLENICKELKHTKI